MRTIYIFNFILIGLLSASVLEAQNFIPLDRFGAASEIQKANGISVVDYDGNGNLDVYIVASDAFDLENRLTWNRLLKNTNGNFLDVTEQSGLLENQYNIDNSNAEMGVKMGASWGDFNNDGFPDLFLTNKGPDQLFKNKGDGTFEEITKVAGVGGCDKCYSSSALWWDYDSDGDLDLYVSDWQYPNRMYKNVGNDQFIDVSVESGLNVGLQTWTSLPIDINKDGFQDLYLMNDFADNDLFINNGDGTFIDRTVIYKLNDIGHGMGVDVCDIKNDGNFDIYLTNIWQEHVNPFFVNQGSFFKNEWSERGFENAGWGWGVRFFDMDHDMDEDLYLVNQKHFLDENLDYNRLFIAENEKFKEVSETYAVNSFPDARGLEIFDFNKDGDLDMIFANWGANATLYSNNISDKGNWIQIELEGTISNRNAFGAVLRAKIKDTSLHRLNHGANYLGQSIKPIHFGLADNEIIDELTIFWPSGRVEKIYDVAVNQFLKIKEGEQAEVFEETYGTIPAPLPDNLISGYSVARKWNELLLESIRNDYARPTVHARNLFHTSMAMYDAWAVYDEEAEPFFLGKTLGAYECLFNGIPSIENSLSAQEEALSYASYRLLTHRFENSPGAASMLQDYISLMKYLGYDPENRNMDYSTGSPAALGNYIANELIHFGLQDGSNEAKDYGNNYYTPSNPPLVVDNPGNPNITYPNKWQPLTLTTFIDQSGNVIEGSTPDFLSPEWGKVVPFALKKENITIRAKNGFHYWIYNDPGKPVEIMPDGVSGLDDPYKWGFVLVSIWSSHLDPNDGVMIDISPASIGNTDINNFPKTFKEYQSFYDLVEGGDIGKGHSINPITNEPYASEIVPRGDYARVLAEFWADGPNSETPPGHWFTILNYVSDHPLTEKKFSDKGDVLSNLEWDVKSYFALGGAMHDAAVTAWSIKGYYDYIRPISAIRYMASKGQSTDTSLENFHSEGIPLIPNYIEVIKEGDLLAGENNEYVDEIKLYAWKGSRFIDNPDTDVAGVDWIRAMDWVPYQRPSFVTPPFAGYVSGHSTFSRAAAEVLSQLTGSNFFPGGMGTFDVEQNEFLVFEDGPSTSFKLQWATYQDASDQTSLSRIWGGIHPPIDDIPGRFLGETIGKSAFDLSESFFYEDLDGDGYYSYEDLDDNNKDVHDEQETENKLEYIIFPIPVEDIMTLKIEYDGILTLSVFNIHGGLVLNKDVIVQNNVCSIPLNNLIPGIYLVVYTNPNKGKIASAKIIKN